MFKNPSKDLINEKEALEEAIKRINSLNDLKYSEMIYLKEIFTDRFTRALNLVLKKSVKKYVFKPSLRELWAVKGRTQSYQVIPSSNYCSCDDFYFRVIGMKKRLCYHIIAQRLAEKLNIFDYIELPDHSYTRITRKWQPRR